MPKRPTKNSVRSKAGGLPNGTAKPLRSADEQRRDFNTKSVLGKFQGRKSI